MTLLQSGAMMQYGAQRLSTARRFATKPQKKGYFWTRCSDGQHARFFSCAYKQKTKPECLAWPLKARSCAPFF